MDGYGGEGVYGDFGFGVMVLWSRWETWFFEWEMRSFLSLDTFVCWMVLLVLALRCVYLWI